MPDSNHALTTADLVATVLARLSRATDEIDQLESPLPHGAGGESEARMGRIRALVGQAVSDIREVGRRNERQREEWQEEEDRRKRFERRQWAAPRIDPATAEVWWTYVQDADPYGEYDLTPEEQQVGRCWFVRDPDDGVVVSYYDLPDATWEAIQQRPASSFGADEDIPF